MQQQHNNQEPGCGCEAEVTDHCATEFDPGLQQCCLRDLQQQQQATRLRAVLLAHDPTAQRGEQLAALIGKPSSSTAADPQGSSEDHDELEELRMRRVAQLQAAASAQATARDEGYGRLTDVPELQLLVRAGVVTQDVMFYGMWKPVEVSTPCVPIPSTAGTPQRPPRLLCGASRGSGPTGACATCVCMTRIRCAL
jgi:hypothetical protein